MVSSVNNWSLIAAKITVGLIAVTALALSIIVFNASNSEILVLRLVLNVVWAFSTEVCVDSRLEAIVDKFSVAVAKWRFSKFTSGKSAFSVAWSNNG